jgi:ABC-type nitrate/sulfonate/bicarbonate transport system substrate-binding protein
MEDLKGKVFGVTRFGTQSDLASRLTLLRYGIDPERDVTMVQTGGPAETVGAMAAGKVHAAAITPPATLQAKKLKLRELLDLSKLDLDYPVNGLVTTRRYIKSNEDTVRCFVRAYVEGAARGQRDKAFAMKAMSKYFRTVSSVSWTRADSSRPCSRENRSGLALSKEFPNLEREDILAS